jgi:hypothetical protein
VRATVSKSKNWMDGNKWAMERSFHPFSRYEPYDNYNDKIIKDQPTTVRQLKVPTLDRMSKGKKMIWTSKI